MSAFFGERVRDAMIAAGLHTPGDLARACARTGYAISRQTASAWMELEEPDLLVKGLIALSRATRVRMWYLATGGVPAGVRAASDEHLSRAMSIMDGLTREQCEEWFKYGQAMARK